MYRQVIPPQNDPYETDGMNLSREELPVTFVADGLQGSEEIAFYCSANGGISWIPYYQAGQWVKLLADDVTCSVYAPIPVKLIKSTTIGAVFVGCYSKYIMS